MSAPATGSNRRETVKALFAEALEQPAAARDAWLDEHSHEEAVRAEVRSLLAAHAEAESGSLLDRPLFGRSAAPASLSGRRVGPWRLGELLGEGGMGAVYRAERADGLYEREVALKLLRPGLPTADLAGRLRAERQVLARLEHPGVARLYDGGVTEEGLPYLAMELVRGEPLTDFAEARALPLRDRVRLFVRVCEAVAYAHRALVVHRDLKPSNILAAEAEAGAGGEPRVKLLDFGIARLLDEDDGTATRTALGALTPAYAAPEQVRGEPITTATDVYALGVLLYELLAGRRPYDVAGKTPSEVERVVAEHEPPPPSTAAAPGRAGALRGDLDQIVMKALAKEPERRYPSADALADDLRRWLGGLPVEARPATAAYRVGKFVRRHRVAAAAAALVALALVAATGVSLWQAGIAAAERDRTAAALAQTEGTLGFLEDTILSGNPAEGDPDLPLSAVLDSAAARVEAEATSPQVAGAIHTSLVAVYNGRGLYDRAEHHARRALALLPDGDGRRGWALDGLAFALKNSGRPADAEPYHRRGVAVLREHGDEPQLATALNNYAGTLATLGRLGEAEAAYRESLALRRALGIETANVLNNLAVLLLERGDPERAAEAFSDLVAALRQEDGPAATYRLQYALVNRANARADLGRSDEAVADFREAHALSADLLGEEHPETIAIGASLTAHLGRAGRTDDALREGLAALATAEAALEAGHPMLAYAQVVVGTVFCNAGEPDRGAALVEASLEARRAMLPPEHWLLAYNENVLGSCIAQLGRDDEAARLLRRGYDGTRAALGDDHPRTVEAQGRLAAFHQTRGRPPESEAPGERR